MSSTVVPTPPLAPGRNLIQTVRAIVAFFAPTAAKQRLLDSMAEVVGEVTQDALAQPEGRRVLDSLTSQPVILDALVLVLELLGKDLSTRLISATFSELSQRAHELLPALSEKARTHLRATALLAVVLVESWNGLEGKDILREINANRGEARRIAGLWAALLLGGSGLGILPVHGEEFARELWTTISQGVDEEVIEDCYWSAAHVEAKAAA